MTINASMRANRVLAQYKYVRSAQRWNVAPSVRGSEHGGSGSADERRFEWRDQAKCTVTLHSHCDRTLKRLSQIFKHRPRLFEVRGFESFREAVVHNSQRIPGLISPPAFAQQASLSHRRPQLPGERGLSARDSDRFGQAVHRCFTIMPRRENARFNPKQFGQVRFHTTVCCARDGSIDREKCLLELPGLP